MAFTLHAQDKIYKKDGSIVEAKVKKVEVKVNHAGTGKVTYKRFDNQDGPDYTVAVNDISKIVYQTGFTDNFESKKPQAKHEDRRQSQSKKYGSNIITLLPTTYTFALDGTIGDPGIGVCYERLLDDHGHFGFSLPVIYSFAQNRDYNNNLYHTSSYTYTGPNNYTSFSIMPGVKFYPAAGNGAVRYAFGASFFATFGREPYDVYDSHFTAGVVPGARGDWKYTMYGAAFSNTVNISVTKHVYMEFGVNGCIPFADNRFRDRADYENVFLPIAQFVLKTGVRL
jgi:hypothetical protein